MGETKGVLMLIVRALDNIASAINNLATQERVVRNQIEYKNVVWLDDVGKYVLIWYADGTGQILTVEGEVHTLSTVGRDGLTAYKLTNGKILEFANKSITTRNP